MLVIGLIGEIGAGKSTVARRLAEQGAEVIDADAVGHHLLRDPNVVARLVAAFGGEILASDGTVERKRVAELVFASRDRLSELEAILHPLMRAEFARRIGEAGTKHDLRGIVLDAAVLLEAGWDDLCDRIVFVTADRPTRLRRLAESRGWSAEQLAVRENAQWPAARKCERADAVIENDGGLDECRHKVDRLVKRWL